MERLPQGVVARGWVTGSLHAKAGWTSASHTEEGIPKVSSNPEALQNKNLDIVAFCWFPSASTHCRIFMVLNAVLAFCNEGFI